MSAQKHGASLNRNSARATSPIVVPFSLLRLWRLKRDGELRCVLTGIHFAVLPHEHPIIRPPVSAFAGQASTGSRRSAHLFHLSLLGYTGRSWSVPQYSHCLTVWHLPYIPRTLPPKSIQCPSEGPPLGKCTCVYLKFANLFAISRYHERVLI